MARDLYVYDVFDIEADAYTLENVPLSTVINELGVDKARVLNAIKYGQKIKNRYIPSRTYLDGTTNPNDADRRIDGFKKTNVPEVKVVVPEELANEWDRVRFILNPKAR